MGYQQLTQTQRYQIQARYELGTSQRQSGRELGLHSSMISSEVRCNATKWTKRLPSMMAAVDSRLREEWSPQQISGFMAPLTGVSVSHQWIYSLIWNDKARGNDLWRHLRQPKRRNKHRPHAKSAGLGIPAGWG